MDYVAPALTPGNKTTIAYDDGAGTITVGFNPEEVDVDWIVRGWTDFDEFLVNDDVPLGTDTTQTVSVVAGRGRITNSSTQGNMRKWYLHDGTAGWMDSEICSLWYGSDVFSTSGTNPSSAQAGHVHRAYTDGSSITRAIVVTNNMFLSDVNVVNSNVWNSDPAYPYNTRLKLGTLGGQKTLSDMALQKRLKVHGVMRYIFGSSYNEYKVSPANLHGLYAGVVCNVDVTLDATFDIASTGVAINGADSGAVSFLDTEAGTAVTDKYETGYILPTTVSARRYWPYWVKSRLIGSKLWIKVWRELDVEPDWSNAAHVSEYDFQGANDPDADDDYPADGALYPTAPGKCGLVGAHIRNTRYLEYGKTTFRKL